MLKPLTYSLALVWLAWLCFLLAVLVAANVAGITLGKNDAILLPLGLLLFMSSLLVKN